ncbi:hypothetical protein BD769DRAFT_1679153 [Suillus cothurnatus]|nr:hypothetical protein BD769DRAFT_1679153 [Suillus cothurnatus]
MSDCDTHTNDPHPSDLDSFEAMLSDANRELENRSGRSTPESHIGCPGYGHGQGAPVYSCGCYKHGLIGWFKPPPSPPEREQAFQLADEFKMEQPEPQLSTQDGDHNNAGVPHSNLKRKKFEDDGDVINLRETSVPGVELLPDERRKIGEDSLTKVLQEFVAVREAMSRIEAIVGRQYGVLHEICNAIENHRM